MKAFTAVERALKPSNRSLIRELVVSDFKIRYQGSVLGYLWSLLRPLMLFVVLYVVFTKIIRLGGSLPYYPIYLLLGIVIWSFFVEATVTGLHSIAGRGDLVRKINIPKYTIVISTTLSAFINFALNMGVVLLFMVLTNVPFRLDVLLAIPLIVELIVLALGLSFWLSALFVRFRDINHIWEVVLQIMFYAVPIIYPFVLPPQWLRELMSLNPITQILQDLRSVLITPETLTVSEVFGSPWARVGSVVLVLLIALLGGMYFRKTSRNFAEDL